ncbi:MAG: helix-turn-helix transcriptional regulator [Bdellovibrionaceae bacterium]|nr:helix-turn-helix transcriptional regulator [Pseudobdellovibrionaceae bacterium]
MKSQDGTIVSQNETCVEVCGHRVGETCAGVCIDGYEGNPGAERASEGTSYFKDQSLHGEPCDVMLIDDLQHLTIVFYLLKDFQKKEIAYLKEKFELSKREMEVAELVVQGLTNKEIAEKLFISASTLKTHLNNIYRKTKGEFLAKWRQAG